jgi:hypothetical protein
MRSRVEMFLRTLIILFLPLFITSHDVSAAEADRSAKGKVAAKADFVVVTVKDSLISLEAKNASLKEVLEEIGRKMNIEVFALLPEQEKITTELEKLPLEDAIERLIRNHPHVIVWQESDRRITKITVLQKSGDTVASKPVTTGPEIKKLEEGSVKPETRVREQDIRKEFPPAKPFRSPGK